MGECKDNRRTRVRAKRIDQKETTPSSPPAATVWPSGEKVAEYTPEKSLVTWMRVGLTGDAFTLASSPVPSS